MYNLRSVKNISYKLGHYCYGPLPDFTEKGLKEVKAYVSINEHGHYSCGDPDKKPRGHWNNVIYTKCIEGNQYLKTLNSTPACVTNISCPALPLPANGSNVQHNYDSSKVYDVIDAVSGTINRIRLYCASNKYQIFNVTSGANLGDELVYGCNWDVEDYGYTTEDLAHLECKRVFCEDPPEPEADSGLLPYTGERVVFGRRLTFYCPTQQRLSNDFEKSALTLTCLEDGSFEGEMTKCVITKTCPPPFDPPSGIVKGRKLFTSKF